MLLYSEMYKEKKSKYEDILRQRNDILAENSNYISINIIINTNITYLTYFTYS